ncbi:hypothetical protein D3C79_817180 [compost metagenome]
MDPVNLIPITVVHLVERLVTQDAGIVDQYIDPTKAVQRLFDDACAVTDGVVVGHSRTTCGADLLDNPIGRRSAGAFPMGGPPKIVDHHLGATRGEQQCMGAAQATTGPRDDHHTVLQTYRLAHALGSRQVQGLECPPASASGQSSSLSLNARR